MDCTTDTVSVIVFNIPPNSIPRRMHLHGDVLETRDVHDSAAEACSYGGEPAVLHLGQEHLVLVGESLVVPADFTDDAVVADTVGTFGVALVKAA